tara:strand:+ start:502 stop:963 length:462 start_codon:yes stop_codon:yes gene_type:complete
MKKIQVIILFVWLSQPNIVRSKPVKGISDFNGEFMKVERITFECPSNLQKDKKRSNGDFDDQQPKERCWVDFHPTYLNIMNKQIIERKDIINFWQSPPKSGRCCASWNLIYKNDNGVRNILSMRKKEFPFPLTKRKLKILGTPSDLINRWLAQ